MARATRWQLALTFGGRVPWAIGLVLSLTVLSSLFVAFGSRHVFPLFEWAALSPAAVWEKGQVFRLLTWPFIQPSPLSLIFTCLMVYWFGSDLANEWGSRRFLLVFGGVALAAAVCTCLVARVDPAVYEQTYLGGWEMTTAMTVAWGLWFPDRVVRIFLVLPIRGYWLAWGTVAITGVFAIYAGWETLLPEIFAEASILAWLFRRSLAARVKSVQRVADARRRERDKRERARRRAKSAAYLHVVEAQDDDPPPLPPEVENKVRDLFRGGGDRGTE